MICTVRLSVTFESKNLHDGELSITTLNLQNELYQTCVRYTINFIRLNIHEIDTEIKNYFIMFSLHGPNVVAWLKKEYKFRQTFASHL